PGPPAGKPPRALVGRGPGRGRQRRRPATTGPVGCHSVSPMQLDLHATRIRTICLCILAAIASGWVLAVLHTVLVPFALALLLAITVSPLVDALVVQARVPRGIATVFTLAIGLLVLLAV